MGKEIEEKLNELNQIIIKLKRIHKEKIDQIFDQIDPNTDMNEETFMYLMEQRNNEII